MSARFAESCRSEPFSLEGVEEDIRAASIRDGRRQKDLCLTCDQDIYIGVFFDGTNNNKYRDTAGLSHSNVARLYEAYPGTPAMQTAPKLAPRVLPDNSTQPRPVQPDEVFKGDIPPEAFAFHRKIYVPGVGTPHPDAGDDGSGLKKTFGLAMALLGQVRMDWALLQLCNQVHAAIIGTSLHDTVNIASLSRTSRRDNWSGWIPDAAEDTYDAWVHAARHLSGQYDTKAIGTLLDDATSRLAAALQRRGAATLPTLRKVRLSVFGFSRGAAQARAWVNLVNDRWAGRLAGLPLQIDFLGIFDTVASVGFAQSVALRQTDGHFAWASGLKMVVPGDVKRCVHLVAALEPRGSFPLDSVSMEGVLPLNCKEIVYPGVHSDVGGGYPPEDQGRCLPAGPEGDSRKPSQISLAQMYREARMAGVPLAPPAAMSARVRSYFAIHPDLRRDFNAYVEATRLARRQPVAGGHPALTSMFPTETQPHEPLLPLMRRHASFLLQWRRQMLRNQGRIAQLPGLQGMQATTKWQDAEDIRGAEDELRKELAFLNSTDPKKFENVDDPLFELLLSTKATVAAAAAGATASMLSALLGFGVVTAGGKLRRWVHESAQAGMHQKQRQWDTWLRGVWYARDGGTLPQGSVHQVQRWFEHYAHDSRAWFKPMLMADRIAIAPDDEDWFTLGGRNQARRRQQAELKAKKEQAASAGDQAAAAALDQQLAALQHEGSPLIRGAREPYRMWGYLRHRTVYMSGALTPAQAGAVDKAYEATDREGLRQALIADEKTYHEQQINRIRQRRDEVWASGQLTQRQKQDYWEGADVQLGNELRRHTRAVDDIHRKFGSPSATATAR